MSETPSAPEPTAAEAPAPAAPDLPVAERPELIALRQLMAAGESVEGTVIGWNKGGYHVALTGLAAFCPRSEMETGKAHRPADYLDQTFPFRVLRIEDGGRRIVLSRAALMRAEKSREREGVRSSLAAGAVVEGKIASLTDFGAFVELGSGVQGLIHVSELAHRRVEHPREVLEEGQSVRVKILKLEKKRISLSLRALEEDPWRAVAARYRVGTTVQGRVQRTEKFGAVIELEPGVTGLLPTSKMELPRDSSAARAFPAGREIAVQVAAVDPKRRRISLGLEGTGAEGSHRDVKDFKRQQDKGTGLNAIAAAFAKLRKPR
ncbi:MAG: 30S ribosomal protein S1 [Thermoanaerobaculia bacterium]